MFKPFIPASAHVLCPLHERNACVPSRASCVQMLEKNVQGGQKQMIVYHIWLIQMRAARLRT